MNTMRFSRLSAPLLLFAAVASAAVRIEVEIPGHNALNGHLVVVLAKESATEPRFQLSETYDSAQAFGQDVKQAAGHPVVLDGAAVGYPLRRLSDIPAGDYFVQAVFNVYEEFHLASGAVVDLPPDRGEGQQWNNKPGNPYSKPSKIHLDPEKSDRVVHISLDQVIAVPSVDPVAETKKDGSDRWLKFVRVHSALLSKFWGRDVSLGAWVLLPDGWADHPDSRFPLVVYQDHFHPDFGAGVAFRTKPRKPDPKGAPEIDYDYQFFQDWTSGRLPRVILLYLQDATPYYDDSYNVNSANMGPYGDAITREVIPAIEKQFRAIGQGWARATYGASTGGWESLAAQIFYPDFYNGVWSSCPDPVDFHAYEAVNLYKDGNAFMRSGPFGRIPIAEMRETDGNIVAEMEPSNRLEYVLGTHGRSGQQFDAWQAVFSPAGADGYPQAVYDKRSGEIDPGVVRYWHDRYDLSAILARDWPALGPKLEGKLHIAAGDADTWFLNNAVHLLQKTLEATRHPHSDAVFDYGPGRPHCYVGGGPALSMDASSGTVNQRVLPLMVEHMLRTAPAGADVTSWRY